MDQKWIQMLVILVFYQTSVSGAGDIVVKERATIEIKCEPPVAYSMVIWFRVLDESGMEFIASFDMNGKKKSTATPLSSNVDDSKMDKRILSLKSFSKARDSGAYGCACIKNNELIFGKVTRLIGEKKAEVTTRAPLVTTGTPNPPATTKPCVCETSPSIYCSTIILGPLAGGCGLLLLLLIITSLYCNQIRTRRCPHHHRRKQRMMAPGKQMKNNTHV
ncbi:T-cell surface glycoprotein CD8 alpha chain [Limanda limanda]|uniref:T-cell surface glycoprotein CD8 alpha chain n=1 Tax=Limanda limanda TaxID=27771 RepID=UPI0029C7CBBE|nr:T-cell surface glycoprotein CD8 alpha chain [Limanda limanda]